MKRRDNIKNHMALKINVLNISCLYNKNEFNLNYIKRFFIKIN